MELTVTTGDWIVYRLLKEHSTIRSSNTNIRGMLTHWKSELRCFKNNLQNISARSEMFLVEGKVRPPRPVNQHRQIPKSKTSCCHRCYTPHVCPPYACSQNFARRSIWVVNIWLHINWIFSVQVEPPEKNYYITIKKSSFRAKTRYLSWGTAASASCGEDRKND